MDQLIKFKKKAMAGSEYPTAPWQPFISEFPSKYPENRGIEDAFS